MLSMTFSEGYIYLMYLHCAPYFDIHSMLSMNFGEGYIYILCTYIVPLTLIYTVCYL